MAEQDKETTTNNPNLRRSKMKNSIVLIALVAFSALAFESAYSQATATQNVTLAVNTVYKLSASSNPGALTITTGTAGTDALTSVSDNSTTYSMTQNYGNAVKITANLDAALAAGYTLQINMASTKGTSAGDVDISNATSGSAVTVVSAINTGADAAQPITYTFSATASAGTLSSTAKVVTLTLTN
jgi:hypothetical protein